MCVRLGCLPWVLPSVRSCGFRTITLAGILSLMSRPVTHLDGFSEDIVCRKEKKRERTNSDSSAWECSLQIIYVSKCLAGLSSHNIFLLLVCHNILHGPMQKCFCGNFELLFSRKLSYSKQPGFFWKFCNGLFSFFSWKWWFTSWRWKLICSQGKELMSSLLGLYWSWGLGVDFAWRALAVVGGRILFENVRLHNSLQLKS